MSLLSLLDIPVLLEDIVGVIGKHVSDPSVMGEIKAQIAAISVPEEIQQAKIEEANQASPDKILKYVRSTVEWICIYGLFVGIVISPLLMMFGFPGVPLPMPVILNLLYALLGLGASHIAESIFTKGL